MGYTTEFRGQFSLDKKLDTETYNLLKKLSETRRMARKVPEEYGVEGEFFFDGKGFMGQDVDDTVIDGNRPPSTQPSLWCQWVPTSDRKNIEWAGGEKFYEYTEWIQYIIDKILIPRGYSLSGSVCFQGEDSGDSGVIGIEGNKAKIIPGTGFSPVSQEELPPKEKVPKSTPLNTKRKLNLKEDL